MTERTPFIPYADPDTLPVAMRVRLGQLAERMGVTSNSMRLYAHRPEIAETIVTMTANILNHPNSTLPRKLKVKLGVICSSTNGCAYCTAHQCELLGRTSGKSAEGWGVPERELLALISGEDKGVDDLERICFEYARTATVSAAEVSDELRTRLAAVLQPPQIVELACVVGYWQFINNVHDSLRVPIEEQMSHRSGYLNTPLNAA